LQNAVKKAGKIIVVSRSTSEGIREMFPGYEDKIRLVYQGVSELFKPLPENEVLVYKNKKGLRKYLLYVGNRKPHKNLYQLVEAFLNP
jgi:glycosyltransferase involved in cell wall biosynthesis